MFVTVMRWTAALTALIIAGNALGHQEFKNQLEHVKPRTPLDVQQKAAWDVMRRTLPGYGERFVVEITGSLAVNTFQIIKTPTNNTVHIRATNGVSACKGFHHYLKYFLNGHVSWSGDQLTNLPAQWPEVNFTSTSASRFIYHQNVCTWSYSFAWWTWNDWRRHIDWMALMGISLTIAPIQEAIWAKVFDDFGLTEDEYLDHFAGPGFQAWQRMGNIRGWGGPLTESYRLNQLHLQARIIRAQRDLGMSVAIPAFAGHVPVALKRVFPNVAMTPVDRWNRFPDQYCCPLYLDPREDLFQRIGTKFLESVIEEFGSDHIYFSDPYNEVNPAKSDEGYVATAASNIYRAMASVDPSAVWLLQGWMFVHSASFWTRSLQKAFLTAVPQGRILVLDLQSEQFPQYTETQSYYGQPFIWCMLHNFGGTLGMHGSAGIVNSRIGLARTMVNSTMVGVGITPEGINQNYVMYELALERGWCRTDFNLTRWFDLYAQVRYGKSDGPTQLAWDILRRTVYSYDLMLKINGKYTIARRPSLKISPWSWYNSTDLTDALRHMLAADASVRQSKLFQHDLVDLSRQFLQVIGDRIYEDIRTQYYLRNATAVTQLGDNFLECLTFLDAILRTNEHFLLGKWLQSAKNLASTPLEREMNEINARNQITTWGPNGQIVDYATKQWSGIVEDYFKPRWRLFVDELRNSLAAKKKFNERKFANRVFKDVESPFTVDRKVYPVQPAGDVVATAQRILQKFAKWV